MKTFRFFYEALKYQPYFHSLCRGFCLDQEIFSSKVFELSHSLVPAEVVFCKTKCLYYKKN